jgi:hypothetical protein
MTLSIDSFALKVVKKAEEASFLTKTKIINIYIPEKIKIYINDNLEKEIKYFKNKHNLEFNIIADKDLILPEYKIDLLNKNKKIIKKIEHIEKVQKNNISKVNFFKKHNSNFKKKTNFKKKNNNYVKSKKNYVKAKNVV